jgi:hypothetical protein
MHSYDALWWNVGETGSPKAWTMFGENVANYVAPHQENDTVVPTSVNAASFDSFMTSTRHSQSGW